MNRRQLFKRTAIVIAGAAAAPLVGSEPAELEAAAPVDDVSDGWISPAEVRALDTTDHLYQVTPSSWVTPDYFKGPTQGVARGVLTSWQRDTIFAGVYRTSITVEWGPETWHLETAGEIGPLDLSRFVEVRIDECGRAVSITPATETVADRDRLADVGRYHHEGPNVEITYPSPPRRGTRYRFDA